MSRRLYLLGVGIALVALGLALADWVLSLQPGVTEANTRRIRPGMTFAEVEALLGPFLTHCADTLGNRVAAREIIRSVSTDHGEAGLLWDGEHGRAVVHFVYGRVQEAHWEPSQRSDTNMLGRLRAWLGW